MEKNKISFFCYYEDGSYTSHVQELDLADVPLWISAYKFTHPACTAISCKLWFNDGVPDLKRIIF